MSLYGLNPSPCAHRRVGFVPDMQLQSSNTLAWTCDTSTYTNFTVLSVKAGFPFLGMNNYAEGADQPRQL